ncbi:MAG TPA: SCO family protein [Bryobacteraceae bacterium]|nr:SCO family protein [Bryobacteraceae bacterium]
MQASKLILILTCAVAIVPAQTIKDRQTSIAASVLPPGLRNVGLEQKLNQQVPLHLNFRDENGRELPLSAYFGQKPVILALVYYQCPMLCTQILNGLVISLRGMSLESGRDFEVVSVSIDPTETPALAARKKAEYLRRYAKSPAGWHFLTGAEPQIRQLADAVGFRYAYDPASKQYAHASAIMVLTPGGRLSKYFYGIEYASRDLRLGLVEASEEKIGTPVDQLLLYCYHYDPHTGKYSAIVMNIVRLAGVLTLLIFLPALFWLWRWDLKRDRPMTPGMAGVRYR